jgi:hypothetical protein
LETPLESSVERFTMGDEKRSFSELVEEAPLAVTEGSITVVGALARSHETGKFVLIFCPENNVTLDIDAVKGYRVLGGAVGQLFVQVEIARDKLSQEALAAITKAGFGFGGAKATRDVPVKNPVVDVPVGKPIVESTGTLAETTVYPGYGDPYFGTAYQGYGQLGPFALVTPHHAPVNVFGHVVGGGGVVPQGGGVTTIAICDVAPPPPPPTTRPLADDPPTYIPGLPRPLD